MKRTLKILFAVVLSILVFGPTVYQTAHAQSAARAQSEQESLPMTLPAHLTTADRLQHCKRILVAVRKDPRRWYNVADHPLWEYEGQQGDFLVILSPEQMRVLSTNRAEVRELWRQAILKAAPELKRSMAKDIREGTDPFINATFGYSPPGSNLADAVRNGITTWQELGLNRNQALVCRQQWLFDHLDQVRSFWNTHPLRSAQKLTKAHLKICHLLQMQCKRMGVTCLVGGGYGSNTLITTFWSSKGYHHSYPLIGDWYIHALWSLSDQELQEIGTTRYELASLALKQARRIASLAYDSHWSIAEEDRAFLAWCLEKGIATRQTFSLSANQARHLHTLLHLKYRWLLVNSKMLSSPLSQT